MMSREAEEWEMRALEEDRNALDATIMRLDALEDRAKEMGITWEDDDDEGTALPHLPPLQPTLLPTLAPTARQARIISTLSAKPPGRPRETRGMPPLLPLPHPPLLPSPLSPLPLLMLQGSLLQSGSGLHLLIQPQLMGCCRPHLMGWP